MKRSPRPRLLPVIALLFGVGLLLPLRAELQTLTDTQGRSIRADVIAVENENVKIKRDDGHTFEVPLASLSEENQRALKAWAARMAAQIPPNSVTLELSRGVFDSSKREEYSTIVIEEKWGYNVTVANRSGKPLSNLTFRYVLFAKPDLEAGKDQRAAGLKRSTGSSTVARLDGGSKTTFRTESIKINKQKLKPGWVWGKTGNNEMVRDTLYGVWIKAYVGDQLVADVCTPESLVKTEKGP